jgi:hypothetical protein
MRLWAIALILANRVAFALVFVLVYLGSGGELCGWYRWCIWIMRLSRCCEVSCLGAVEQGMRIVGICSSGRIISVWGYGTSSILHSPSIVYTSLGLSLVLQNRYFACCRLRAHVLFSTRSALHDLPHSILGFRVPLLLSSLSLVLNFPGVQALLESSILAGSVTLRLQLQLQLRNLGMYKCRHRLPG